MTFQFTGTAPEPEIIQFNNAHDCINLSLVLCGYEHNGFLVRQNFGIVLKTLRYGPHIGICLWCPFRFHIAILTNRKL